MLVVKHCRPYCANLVYLTCWHGLFFVQKAGFMLVEVSFARNVKEKRNVVITVRA